MARKPFRIPLAAASTLVGLFLCNYIWQGRPVSASAALVDNRAQVEALIASNIEAAKNSGDPNVLLDKPGAYVADLKRDLPPLHRRPITLDAATTLFSALQFKGVQYDAHTYFWSNPNLSYKRRFEEHASGGWTIRTNDLGFRKSIDVLEEKPDVRILIAGDSHTGGVVPENENLTQVLERLIATRNSDETIEALNGGHGGFGFYQYLGTLERNLELDPDVFVVVGFGGNDFRESARLGRYHHNLPAFVPERKLPRKCRPRVQAVRTEILAQDLMQLFEFAETKSRMRVAELVTCQIMAEVKRRCDEAGIRLIYVHIPPSMDVQPQILGEFREPILEICKLTEEELTRTDQLTDRLMAYLDVIGVESIDMRATFAASEEDCYWRSDFHINTRGHRLVAEALASRLLPN